METKTFAKIVLLSLFTISLLSSLPSSAQATCPDQIQCAQGSYCFQGSCVPPCPQFQCPDGYICNSGQCSLDLQAGPVAFCGNGQVDAGEQCEAGVFGIGGGGCSATEYCSACQCRPQWLPTALIAFIISVSLIAFTYMGGISFNSVELKTYANDEITQLIFTAFAIAALFGMVSYIDSSLLPAFVSGTTPEGEQPFQGTMQDYALQTAAGTRAQFESYLSTSLSIAKTIGEQGSKSGYCSVLGLGYSIVSCSAINSIRSPVTNAATSLSLAVADFQAVFSLLTFGRDYAFSLLLPMGIFLRTFSFTRKVGGALIAFAVGFYIVLPLAYLFSEKILMGQILDSDPNLYAYKNGLPYTPPAYCTCPDIALSHGGECTQPELNGGCTTSGGQLIYQILPSQTTGATCDSFDFSYGNIRSNFITPFLGQTNIGGTEYCATPQGARIHDGQCTQQELAAGDTNSGGNYVYNFEPVLFQVYIHAILTTALNLTLTLLFIQWLAGILGSQIDASSLMRISQ